MTVGLSYENILARLEPCLVGRRIMPRAPLHIHPGRFCGCGGGVGGRIGPARVGSKLRGCKGHRVLMLLLQALGYFRGQGRIHLFFDPFFALVFRFHLRNLALQTAAEPAVGSQLITRIQLKGAARLVGLIFVFGRAANNQRPQIFRQILRACDR